MSRSHVPEHRMINTQPLATISAYVGLLFREQLTALQMFEVIANLLGNILLLVPVCIGFACLIELINHKWALMLFAVALSFSFETLQYLSGRGLFDVDDIILNVFGVWLAVIALEKRFSKLTKNQD